MGRLTATCLLAVAMVWGCSDERSSTPGAVVESFEPGEAAAVAGLEPGDLVTEWRHGHAVGDVVSPFHLALVEQELAPHGPVELVVHRDGHCRRVVLPTGQWKLRMRPVLPPAALASHLEARQLAENGDVGGAVRRWQELAAELAARDRALDAAWLRAEAAVALARGGRPEACRAALDEGAAAITDRALLAAYRERAGDGLLAAGQTALAADAFRSAADLAAAQAPASPAVAFALRQLCRADLRACGDDATRAVEIYRTIGEGCIEIASALNTAAAAAFMQSDLDAAEAGYLEALGVAQAVAPGSPTELSLLGNLGLVAMRRGDLDAARSYFRRQQAGAERIGGDTLGYAANYLGLLEKNLGRNEQARLHYEQALASFRAVRPGGVEVAGVLNNLGTVARAAGDLAAARHFHEEALRLRRSFDPDGADVAASLHNLGTVAVAQEDLADARRFFEEALELKLASHPGSVWTANTYHELGGIDLSEGRLDRAAELHRAALEIRRRVAPEHPDVATSLHSLGLVALARGRPEAADEHLREAVRLVEEQRRRLDLRDEQRAHFKARYRAIYLDLAHLMVERGRPEEAWDLLEQARAGALRAVVSRRATAPASVPRELWSARNRAEAAVARLERRLAGVDPVADPATLTRYRSQLESAEAELREITAEIRAVAPRYTALDAPPALTLAELRDALAPGTIVLAYAIGEETSFALASGAVADGGPEVRSFEIAASSGDLRSRIDRFNALIARGGAVTELEPALLAQGRRLFDLLVAPVADAVLTAERILVVPDGPLCELPFAALVLSGEAPTFLGHEAALFMSPSASLAVEVGSGHESRPLGERTVVAFGDPVYPPSSLHVREHGLRPLPGTRVEVEAIQRLLGDRAMVFLGAEATDSRLKEAGRDADILHCAVHAHVHPDAPMDSELFFSLPAGGTDADDDGVLTGWEIVDSVHTDADLVVLSSCATARGRVIPGEGIIGLARAFQVAGARSLLVSQWPVPDRSTAELMAAFYDRLTSGLSTVEALRRARRDIAAGDPALRHPFHWAAFELRGSWR